MEFNRKKYILLEEYDISKIRLVECLEKVFNMRSVLACNRTRLNCNMMLQISEILQVSIKGFVAKKIGDN